MDFRKLAEERGRLLGQANQRIMHLENAAASADLQSHHQDIKMEDRDTEKETKSAAAVERSRELESRNQKLEAEVTAYTDCLNKLREAGITAHDVPEVAKTLLEMCDENESLKSQIHSAKGTEAALRTQASNYEKRTKQAEKTLHLSETKADNALKKVQSLKATLSRERSSNNLPSSQVTPSPKTPASAKSKFQGDQDDEESTIKVTPKHGPRKSISKMLGGK